MLSHFYSHSFTFVIESKEVNIELWKTKTGLIYQNLNEKQIPVDSFYFQVNDR